MKKLIGLVVLALLWVGMAEAKITRVQVSPPLPRSTDEITITVTGYFRDGCWSVDWKQVVVSGQEVDVEIHAVDVSGPDVYCPLVIVDYSFSFSLGHLPEGVYALKVLEFHVSNRSPDAQVNLSDFAVSGPTGIGDGGTVTPFQHTLAQNFPNPFNPRTVISYTLAGPDWVELSIYDIQGRIVAVLPRARHDRGLHTVVWDGRTTLGGPAPTGVYLYRITTGKGTLTRKMMLLR